MELFPAMTMFYEALEADPRMGTTHISLYMALLQQWNINGGLHPLQIRRTSIMSAAKINARQTYNKCMKDLHQFGYIRYLPSFDSYNCSTVFLVGLQTATAFTIQPVLNN